MITLTTAEKIDVVLAGAVTTNQIQFVADYIDTTTDTQGHFDGVTNNTVDVDVVTAPAADLRNVYQMSFYNADTASATVTVKMDDGVNERIYVKKEISSGESLCYEHSQGWYVAFSASGGGGTGDVTKVGTPVNNQVGIWTGDGTIEGDANVTYDGSTFDVANGIRGQTVTAGETNVLRGQYFAAGAPSAGTAGGLYRILNAQDHTGTYAYWDVSTDSGDFSITADGETAAVEIDGTKVEFDRKVSITDSATRPPLNVTERSTVPSSPAANDIYLDDGTNTASTNPGWRRYTGAAWEDISAASGGGTSSALPATDNVKTADFSITSGEFNELVTQSAATAAARTFTLPSVGSGDEGSIVWIRNLSADYFLYIAASDSDTIGWPDLSVDSAELVGAGVTVALRYDHSDTRWDLVYRAGGGQFRPKGTVLYASMDTLDRDGTNVSCLDDTNRNYLAGSATTWDYGQTQAKFGRLVPIFNGSSGYMTSPDSTDWDIFGSTSNVFTISLWMYLDTSGSDESLVAQWEDGNNFWQLQKTSSETIRMYYTTGAGEQINQTGGSISTATWTHIAWVADGNGPTAVFINGSQVSYDAAFGLDTFAGSLFLGQRGNSSQYLDGRLDDVAIVYGNILGATIDSDGSSGTCTQPSQALDLVW